MYNYHISISSISILLYLSILSSKNLNKKRKHTSCAVVDLNVSKVIEETGVFNTFCRAAIYALEY